MLLPPRPVSLRTQYADCLTAPPREGCALKIPEDDDLDAQLGRLREDNEALRISSLIYAGIADRLAQRVRELERLLGDRVTKSR